MAKYHKHSGVSDYHLITQSHKDQKTQKAHNAMMDKSPTQNKKLAKALKKSSVDVTNKKSGAAEGLKKLFSKATPAKPASVQQRVERATTRQEVPVQQSAVRGTYEVDLTKQLQIEKLVVKFKDKNGKEAVLSIPNFS